MSVVPSFEIDFWNAWIFMVCSLILAFLAPFVAKGRERGVSFTTAFSKKQKIAHVSLHVIYFLLVIYSIFLPLKLGTLWFYVGLPICVLGLILYKIVVLSFAITPPDRPITGGIYRYSRHPMYLVPVLVFIGVGIASASWLFLLFSVIYMILPPLFVAAEEDFCLKHYGDTYRQYMNRTPRWIGIPKSGEK
jgi:protein-S-isoprenylcysteine O-methyltransferase Ste14